MKSYPFLKVKLGTPGKESLDEERIRAIRAARPDARIRVDANAAWDAEETIALIRRLEKYDLKLRKVMLSCAEYIGVVNGNHLN